MRLSRIVLLILVGIFIAQTVYYYPNLPETIATHFDGAGRADGFMTKQFFVVFEAGLLLLIIAEFTLLPFLIEKIPDSMINLPNKHYWLGETRRGETFLSIRKYFEWFSILLLVMFTAVNQLVFHANIYRENLSSVGMWLILGVFFVLVLAWLVSFVRRFKVSSREV